VGFADVKKKLIIILLNESHSRWSYFDSSSAWHGPRQLLINRVLNQERLELSESEDVTNSNLKRIVKSAGQP
jgi:hypothetical protein